MSNHRRTKRTLVRDLSLEPGDILLLRISGFVGWVVWLMQAINRDLSYWTHAAVVLDDGTVFEAQPGGAVITPLSKYLDRPGSVVRYYQTFGGLMPLAYVMTPGIRAAVVREARAMHDRGYEYAWSTYLYLALVRFGVKPNWVKWRVQQFDRGICSQAADLLVSDATVHLFSDGRMPYDVTPGDLARLALP